MTGIHFKGIFMESKASVRIEVEKLKEIMVLAYRYLKLRDQDCDTVDSFGAYAPYAVQGQTGNWLHGPALDNAITDNFGEFDADEAMYNLIELDMLGNPV